MTCWFCDRCGKQVHKTMEGAGPYSITVTGHEVDTSGRYETFRRSLKFCDDCSLRIEKVLDEELKNLPHEVSAELKKGIL